MDQAVVAQAAEALLDARTKVVPMAELPTNIRPTNQDEAYRVQDAFVTLIGDQVAGYKVGCTNEAAQVMLKSPGPFSGRILAQRVWESPVELKADMFAMRGLEVEMAFRLGQDLPPEGAPYNRDNVVDAIGSMHPALEIVDSRYVSWLERGAPQLIADNGCHGGFVYGAAATNWQNVDLAAHRVTIHVNGEFVDEGHGRNVLGHPLEVVAWLANQRAERGDGLKAGYFISTGTCCPDLGWVDAGDVAVADFGSLGSVEIRFV